MTNDRHLQSGEAERAPRSASSQPAHLDRYRPDKTAIDISALIDSELSRAASERVEARLLTDPDSLRDYRQLARLSRAIKAMPTPKSAISAEELASRTIATARERKQRRRSVASWGGTAIAALFVATVSLSAGLRFNRQVPNVAQTPTPVRDTSIADADISGIEPAANVSETETVVDEPESLLLDRALFVE